MKSLASRFHKAYSDIIGEYYDPERYIFRSSPPPRIYKSFEAFASGLFGLFAPQYIIATPNNSILHPYDSCPIWGKINGEIRAKTGEPWRFLIDHTNLIEEVSQRLGFKTPLEVDTIEDIFEMCSYETAFNHEKPSAWCVVSST